MDSKSSSPNGIISVLYFKEFRLVGLTPRAGLPNSYGWIKNRTGWFESGLPARIGWFIVCQAGLRYYFYSLINKGLE
jgi:hypothetical protein